MHIELIALLGALSFLTDTVSAERCTYYRYCESGYYCCRSNTRCCKDEVTGGAIAGIVIGCLFVLFVVVFIVILCYKQQQARQRRITDVQPATATVAYVQQGSMPPPGYSAPPPGYGNMPPPQNKGMYPPSSSDPVYPPPAAQY